MVKIDGKLTDATFKVKSDALQINDRGNKIYVYCVEAYEKDNPYIMDYIAEKLALYVKAKYNAKDTDEMFINIEFNVNKEIGDII